MIIEARFLMPHITLKAVLLLVLSVFSQHCMAYSFKDAITAKTEEIKVTGKLVVGDRSLYAPQFVNGIYQLNDFELLWDSSNTDKLIEALENLEKDGLNPADYIFEEAREMLSASRLSDKERLDLDCLLSEGLVRAMYNLAFGKVDAVSLDANFNFARKIPGIDLTALLYEHIRKAEIKELLELARPKQPVYKALMSGLEQYRAIQKSGGWQPVSYGNVLKAGMSDPRIAQLKKRLKATGDFTGEEQGYVFDSDVEQAVLRFQRRHGIEVDGIVGKGTIALLNVPVEQRIQQIKVNLERLRWYLHEAVGEFIVADIAGFHVYWIKDGEVIWDEMAQVGKSYAATPVFSDEIEYLELNPTWTIPPGIMKRSVIPAMQQDPDYLAKKGYLLLTFEGKEVDPKSVDWGAKSFPYLVRQPAGSNNAMGRVKFMFPNPHLVFLHDTNRRDLFGQSKRTFSSGCIRVNKPLDLAAKLLKSNADGWSRKKLDKIIASGKTTRVNLDKPMKIIIAYTTAASRDGVVQFREDIYQRDARVIKALEGDFRLRSQDKKKK